MDSIRRKKFSYLIILILFSLTCIIHITCTKKNIKDTDINKDNKDNNELLKEYLDEGFISDNQFRIVIVEPVEKQTNEDTIMNNARQRALMSLQKYLSTKNIILSGRGKTELLNFVNREGKLTHISDHAKSREVYLFEIKKYDLKNHIHKISSGR